jgi:hypothetical protein
MLLTIIFQEVLLIEVTMRFIILILLFSASAEARQIILDIPDRDIAIAENDVIDAEEWIRGAWDGKLNKCKERMKNAEIKKSIDSQEGIPAGLEAIIDKHLARPGYQSRKTRDAVGE